MSIIKLIATGDICLQSRNGKNPFSGVRDFIKEKDILFGNLETVLSDKGQEAEKAVVWHTSPDKVRYLKEVGFDILSVGNNHIMDRGIEGFNETLEVLAGNDLKFIGAGNHKYHLDFVTIKKKGLTLGFSGYHEHGFEDSKKDIFIAPINEDKIVQDIKKMRTQNCDIITISLHWGIENAFYPSPKQIKLARRLVDTGATLIVGHHPHVIQGIEKYKHGLIAYSLGNFQFKGSSEYSKKSVILSVDFEEHAIVDHQINPIKINDDYIPVGMNSQMAQEMLSFIDEISHPIIKDRIMEKWWFEEIASAHLSGNLKAWILRIRKYGIKHFLQCLKWNLSPFNIKCYLGLLRKKIKKYV